MTPILVVIGLAALMVGAFWWVPATRYVAAGCLVLVQMVIWWFAHELDGGVPWNPDRPLLTMSVDPLWLRSVFAIVLYGPLAMAGWRLMKARR